jgi:hypothetical protein
MRQLAPATLRALQPLVLLLFQLLLVLLLLPLALALLECLHTQVRASHLDPATPLTRRQHSNSHSSHSSLSQACGHYRSSTISHPSQHRNSQLSMASLAAAAAAAFACVQPMQVQQHNRHSHSHSSMMQTMSCLLLLRQGFSTSWRCFQGLWRSTG